MGCNGWKSFKIFEKLNFLTKIHVNVDFFAGVIYYLSGIPQDLFVPIFAVGRIPGWVIQVLEQYEHNILIRPLLKYTGQRERTYIPLQDRV